MAHFIFYNGTINPLGARNAQTLINVALEEGKREIVFCLTSSGGDVTAGMGLYHYIRMAPVPIHVHAMGTCTSIAATILLAGETRTAADPTQIALHAPTFSDGPQKGQVAPTTEVIAQPFRERLGWINEQVLAHFKPKRDVQVSLNEALQHGMISEVKHIKLEASDTQVIVGIP